MLINTEVAKKLQLPNIDFYDESLGIIYGEHPCYTKKSQRLSKKYQYIRSGGIIHPII